MRPLADLIRGKYADEALDILKYQPQRGARLLEKVLKSALGNAEDRRAQNLQDLVVVDCRVDGGPMFKRDPAACPRHGVHDQAADVAHSRDAGRHRA